MEKQAIGRMGEELAARYLVKKGFRILSRNYRKKIGEIDIIACDLEDILIFVEVKTRHFSSYGTPAEAVDFRKQQRIQRTAFLFMQERNLSASFCRFDIIEVYISSHEVYKIRQIENAFEGNGF
jgi:putative endonuclease